MSWAQVFSDLTHICINVQLGSITVQHLTQEMLNYIILVLEILNEKFYLFQLPKEASS